MPKKWNRFRPRPHKVHFVNVLLFEVGGSLRWYLERFIHWVDTEGGGLAYWRQFTTISDLWSAFEIYLGNHENLTGNIRKPMSVQREMMLVTANEGTREE